MRGINVIKRIFSTNIQTYNNFYPYAIKRHMFFDLNNPELNSELKKIDKNTILVYKTKNNLSPKLTRNKIEMHESHSAKPFLFNNKFNNND